MQLTRRREHLLGVALLVAAVCLTALVSYREGSRSGSVLSGLLLGLTAIWAFLWLLRRYLNEVERSTAVIRAQALQEADQRKDEFLAMLAHELRNPLTAVDLS